MASGAVRSDITVAHSLTAYENRNIKWTLKDSNGDDLTDFGVREFKFWLLETLGSANGVAELDTEALFSINDAGLTKAVPLVTAPLTPANWTTIKAQVDLSMYAYELWRVDTDNVYRLAYGDVRLED